MRIDASREFEVITQTVGRVELAAIQICDETVMHDLIDHLAKLLSDYCEKPPLNLDPATIIGNHGFLYDPDQVINKRIAKRPDSR